MRIAIVGPGAIGSTFAFQLAQAGHDVTVVARNQRLAQLRRDGAIATAAGKRATVSVSDALDSTTEWDLVLVTVLASQVDAVMPTLRASRAKAIMFMFNTFEPLDALRDAVGASRFAFGFPAIMANLADGKLTHEIFSVGQITTVSDEAWVPVFKAAGIPTVAHRDMHGWLRSHAAFVAPLMAMSVRVHATKHGLSMSEAGTYARGLKDGFRLVRSLGHALTPFAIRFLATLPRFMITFVFFFMSRSKLIQDLGALGPNEARMLIDSMASAAPNHALSLTEIRP